MISSGPPLSILAAGALSALALPAALRPQSPAPQEPPTARAGMAVPAEDDGSRADAGEPRDGPPLGEQVELLGDAFGAGRWDEVLAAGADVVRREGELPELRRGELHFALAFARTMAAGEAGPAPATAPDPGAPFVQAAEGFWRSRALAGPGSLRTTATYDAGLAFLLRAEAWRERIPEIAAKTGAPAGQPAPGAPGAGAPAGPAAPDATPPDPLEQARAAYSEAKQTFVEGLRADWRDVDTRANLELIQRRLAELDEIERVREDEGETPREQDPEKQGGEGEQQPEGEQPEGGEQGDPQDQEEGGASEQEPQQGEPEEGDPDQPQESEERPSEQPQDEQQGDDTTANDVRETEALPEGQGEAHARRPVEAERVLTHEEVIRLLDRLAEIEAEGRELGEARLGRTRARVDRDW